MTRTTNKERIEPSGLDAPAQMGVAEVEAGARAPVAKQARLDVLGDQGAAQQGVVHEIDLAHRQVVGGPEVLVELSQFVPLRWGGGARGVDIGHRPSIRRIGDPCPSVCRCDGSIWHRGHVNILVVNAGSSSLKLRLLDDANRVIAGKDAPSPDPEHVGDALHAFVDENPQFEAAGHRVVHGGSKFKKSILLDDAADDALEALADLAPLHNPPSLAAIDALRSLRPDLPQIACFDTSFHADLPARAALAFTWKNTRLHRVVDGEQGGESSLSIPRARPGPTLPSKR